MSYFQKDCFHPKYWALFFVLSVFWLLTRLPYLWQIKIGKKLGRVLVGLHKRAKVTVDKNISLCFSTASKAEQEKISRESAIELGISVMETFLVWFRALTPFFQDRVKLEGESHFEEALAQERGILLLSCHFGSVDLNAALLASLNRNGKEFVATYRQTDGVINRFLESARGKYCDRQVSSTNQRAIVKALKRGDIVWYAPDIEVKKKGAIFSEFMGVSAHTTTAIPRLAKIADAIVIPVGHYRIDDSPQYRLKIFPPLRDFPSADIDNDTRKINAMIENIIEPHPERYWWVIKRFKVQPNGISPYQHVRAS